MKLREKSLNQRKTEFTNITETISSSIYQTTKLKLLKKEFPWNIKKKKLPLTFYSPKKKKETKKIGINFSRFNYSYEVIIYIWNYRDTAVCLRDTIPATVGQPCEHNVSQSVARLKTMAEITPRAPTTWPTFVRGKETRDSQIDAWIALRCRPKFITHSVLSGRA